MVEAAVVVAAAAVEATDKDNIEDVLLSAEEWAKEKDRKKGDGESCMSTYQS